MQGGESLQSVLYRKIQGFVNILALPWNDALPNGRKSRIPDQRPRDPPTPCNSHHGNRTCTTLAALTLTLCFAAVCINQRLVQGELSLQM